MKHNTTLYTLLFLCFLSCARQPQKSSEGFVVEIPHWYNTDSLRTEYLYSEGVKMVALAGDKREALPYFEKVLEIDSLHSATLYQVGNILMKDNPQVAMRYGRIIAQADSTNVDYLGLYAYALAHNHEYAKARGVYERLVKLDPHNEFNYQILATLYRIDNMPYMALTLLDSAEYRMGRTEELFGEKLTILRSMKLYDRAIEEMKRKIANDPRNANDLAVLGYICAEAYQDSLAEATFNRAIAISPQNTPALIGLAFLYKDRGREEKFLQTLKQLFLVDNYPASDAISILESDVIDNKEFYARNFFTINSLITALYIKHPNNDEVALCYANHLIAAGETEMGLDIYKRLVRESHYAYGDNLLCVVGGEQFLGRPDSALYYIDKSIEHNPKEVGPYRSKAYILLGEDTPQSIEEAKALFKKALKVTTSAETKSDLYGILANLEFNPNKAARLWGKALENNPNNAMALNNWAYMLVDNPKQLSRALEMSTRACELEPANPTYLDTKAWILFLMGNIEEAKRIMRQAISLDSEGDGTLLHHYGDILAAEGDAFMAEIYYKRALEAGDEDAEVIEAKIAALKQK